MELLGSCFFPDTLSQHGSQFLRETQLAIQACDHFHSAFYILGDGPIGPQPSEISGKHIGRHFCALPREPCLNLTMCGEIIKQGMPLNSFQVLQQRGWNKGTFFLCSLF